MLSFFEKIHGKKENPTFLDTKPTKTNPPKSRIKDKIMKYSVGWKNGI